MLFEGFTPLYAGSMGLALTVPLILGASIVAGFPSQATRYIFWIGLALVIGSLFRNGTSVDIRYVAAVVLLLVMLSALTIGGRATLLACRDSLAESMLFVLS